MSTTSLPRELKLIIDDIANQNNHLLEWEVFGNATEDMRIVLTWRRLDSKKASPRRASLGKWKLRQSSITVDEPGEILENGSSLHDKKGENWNMKQKGGTNNQAQIQEEEDDEKRKMQEAQKKKEEERARRRAADEEEDERRRLELERKNKEKEERERQKREEEERKRKEEEAERRNREEKERKKQEEAERKRKEEEIERKNREEAEKRKKKEEEERRREAEEREREEEERQKKENERRKKKEAEERRREEEEEERQRQENVTKRKREAEERRRKEAEEEENGRKENLEAEQRQREVEEEKRRKEEEHERNMAEAERKKREDMEKKKNEEEKSKKTKGEGDGDEEVKNVSNKKKKNPFRKLKKDEKIRTKGKLQLSLSIDEGNLEPAENSSERNIGQKQVLSAEEQELVDRLLKRDVGKQDEEDNERIKSEEAAKKLLNMQRQRFKMSIDDEAFDTLPDVHPTRDDSSDVSNRMGDISEIDYDHVHHSKKRGEENTQKGREMNSRYIDDALLRVKPLSEIVLGKTGWEKCADCKYNGFCDDLVHKAEYMTIILTDMQLDPKTVKACDCYVCKSGAVHNGCVFRELLRLKTEYKLFDKRNLCFCKVCIPFKYRKICLRQEIRLLRAQDHDLYYRLTFHGEDGNEGYHPADLEDSDNYSDEDIDNDDVIDAMCLDDINMDITKADKMDFRNCIDCHFNGFCDNIRHKKLYLMLLRIDDEDFEELEDTCGCLVCEFKGAAHSGCAQREIKRLKYDLLLFDSRNLCACRQCVPFKYRAICLRQEMKQLRRKRAINLYNKL